VTPTDSDFFVMIRGGIIHSRHARAFEAMRECDHLVASGHRAFFIGCLQRRLQLGAKR
jgi:hypothetical protein